MRNKGYIYTIVSLLFGLLLLAVITLQTQSVKTTTEIEPGKIRTDELHYFVESTKKDMNRAMAISGRRASVYLVDYVVTTNKGNPVNNAESALAEMILNGTFTNSSGTFKVIPMENHTMKAWLTKVNKTGDEFHFDVNITPTSMEIYPFDESHFLQIITLNFDISDKRGSNKREMCRYRDSKIRIYAISSIEGVEDPTYPSRTSNKVLRYFTFEEDADTTNSTYYVQKLSYAQSGNGTGGGKIIDLHLLGSSALSDNITNFSQTTPQLVEYSVFVINVTYGSLTQSAKDVLAQSGGVIAYTDAALNGNGFPYVAGLSYINFSTKQYAVIRNGINHTIEYLYINDEIQNKTYSVDSTQKGPSFFDRLEGRLNLSNKYVNLTAKGRAAIGLNSTAIISLESLVNISEFDSFCLYSVSGGRCGETEWGSGILDPFINQTSVDYIYFNNTHGNWVYGTPEWFRLDGKHVGTRNLIEYAYDKNLTSAWHFNEGVGNLTYGEGRTTYLGVINTTYTSGGWVLGKDKTALSFTDGSYVDIKGASFNYKPEWTFTAWIYPANRTGPGINTDYVYSEGTPQVTFVLSCTDKINVGVWNIDYPGNWKWASSTDGSITHHEWNFIAVTLKEGGINTGTMNFYVNGALINSISSQMENNSATAYSMFGENTGAHNGGAQFHAYFNGTIDEVKIYNRALSDEEVMDEYNKLV